MANLNSETVLIYGLLVENRLELLTDIQPHYILNDINREIVKNIIYTMQDDKKCDINSVITHVNNQEYKSIIKQSIITRIKEIADDVIFVTDDLQENLKIQYIQNEHKKLSVLLLDDSLTIENKNDALHKVYENMYREMDKKGLLNFQELINQYIKDINAGKQSEFNKKCIDLKSLHFKKMFGDTIKPVVNILGGLPGFHKTGILLNLIVELTELKKIGMLFSFEDPIEIWRCKYMAINHNVDFNELLKGQITEMNIDRINNQYKDKKENKLWITSEPYNIYEFQKEVDRQMLIRKYDYIVIDYIELFRYKHNDEPRQLKIIMNELRRISIKYLIPIIVLSQLDRRKDKGGEVIPKLSDLYGSSGLEKAARRIIMIGGERDSAYRNIYIRKSSYTKLYDFKIEMCNWSGKIEGVV